MNKKLIFKIFILMLILFLFTGCGLTSNLGLRNGACYWINQVRYDLPSKPAQTQSSSKFSLLNTELTQQGLDGFNGDVYVVGRVGNGDAFLWKNSEVSFFKNIELIDIFVSGGDVYLAGSYWENGTGHACYWKNWQRVDLEDGGTPSSIFVKDSVVYVAGYKWITGDNSYDIIACYWVNGKKITLNGTLANGIFVENNDVYISGTYTYEGTRGCYWKNGIRFDLDNDYATGVFAKNSTAYVAGYGDNNNQANAIFVEGNDIYLAGSYDRRIDVHATTKAPCYWRNGEFIPLETSEYPDWGQIMDIFVSGSDIFMIGYWSKNDWGILNGLWFNGKLIPMDGLVNSIFVTKP